MKRNSIDVYVGGGYDEADKTEPTKNTDGEFAYQYTGDLPALSISALCQKDSDDNQANHTRSKRCGKGK